jgi:hypothetical protein
LVELPRPKILFYLIGFYIFFDEFSLGVYPFVISSEILALSYLGNEGWTVLISAAFIKTHRKLFFFLEPICLRNKACIIVIDFLIEAFLVLAMR